MSRIMKLRCSHLLFHFDEPGNPLSLTYCLTGYEFSQSLQVAILAKFPQTLCLDCGQLRTFHKYP